MYIRRTNTSDAYAAKHVALQAAFVEGNKCTIEVMPRHRQVGPQPGVKHCYTVRFYEYGFTLKIQK